MKLRELKYFLNNDDVFKSFSKMYRRHFSTAIGAHVEKYNNEISLFNFSKSIILYCILSESEGYVFIKHLLTYTKIDDELIYLIMRLVENPVYAKFEIGSGKILVSYQDEGLPDMNSVFAVKEYRYKEYTDKKPIARKLTLSQDFFTYLNQIFLKGQE